MITEVINLFILFVLKFRLTLGCISPILCKWVKSLFFFPNFLCLRCPFCSVIVTFCTKLLCTFCFNKVSGFCTAYFNNMTKCLRIFKHRTWTKPIVIKGLTLVILVEQGRTQTFQYRFFTDVGIAVMNKYTGLYIALAVDMKIVSSTCNATAYKFRIILKINGKYGFSFIFVALVAYCTKNMFSLLRC